MEAHHPRAGCSSHSTDIAYGYKPLDDAGREIVLGTPAIFGRPGSVRQRVDFTGCGKVSRRHSDCLEGHTPGWSPTRAKALQ